MLGEPARAERGYDPDPLNLTQFMLPEGSWFTIS